MKSNINKKTIGILGGMGSYSTLYFFKKLLDSYDVEKEWERPRIIIDNYCTLPSRVRAIIYNENYDKVLKGIIDSINKLLLYNPTHIVIPCNTAHSFLDEVYKEIPSSKSKIINLIDLVLKECKKYKEVNILCSEGTKDSKVYEKNNKINIKYGDLNTIRNYIEKVKTNKYSEIIDNFVYFLNSFSDYPTILGCTELSLLYDNIDKTKVKTTIIDPLDLVIRRIINE